MRYIKYFYIILIIFSGQGNFVLSQTYKFNFYGIEEGLPEQFIYTINQDNNGFLWIGTGSGLAKFDGHNFEIFNENNSLPGSFVNVCYIDDENRLWFGFKNGKLSIFNGSEFKNISISDKFTGVINDIVGYNHTTYVASQNKGIAVFENNQNTKIITNNLEDKLIYCIEVLLENKLLIGTNEGLYTYDPLSSEIVLIDEVPMTGITSLLKTDNNEYYAGTEDEGVYKIKFNNENVNIVKFGVDNNLENYKIQNIYKDKENNLWISTFGNGLYKYVYDKIKANYTNVIIFNKHNGLNSMNVKTMLEDFEGNIWIGTYGEGLSTIVDDFFAFYYNKTNTNDNNILSVFAEEKTVYLGSENSLIAVNLDSIDIWENIGEKYNLPDDKITAIYKDAAGKLWIGTDKNGIFELKNNRFLQISMSEDLLTNSINYIDGYGNYLWIATKNGLISFNKKTEDFKIYNTENGLPHNNINHIFIDINGNVWIATQSNDLYVIEKGKIVKHKISNSNEVLKIKQILRSNDGKIWIATYGSGVYSYDYKNFIRYSTNNGLKSNYCYSIMFDENRNIWVGHRQGISKIDTKGQIKTYGKSDGILGDCNKNAIYQDFSGCIWFGTTNGVVRYNYRKDKKNLIAPYTNITGVKFSDKQAHNLPDIEMSYGIYKLRIDFVGISYKDPGGVTYKYKLEGYDLDWNETKNRYVVYNRIEDGDYTFLIKSCNSDGICNEVPKSLNISIVPPIWKNIWFIAAVIAFILYVIYLIIKIREKNHKRLQEYLQKTLDERTKEVVEQKNKLEQANKDITDSINYAKRIQQAILPTSELLKKYFPDSVIYYKPRDIVSGDFYWFEKINNKFIVICADATGHGIPGAFMSLISVTLIKDILKINENLSPSEFLLILDNEIKNTLNQSVKEFGISTNDGLDMTICEIDMNTNKLRVASAMRPVFIQTNDKLEYIKGNRFSIGGTFNHDKRFDNKEFNLKKGDSLYLFSDGYADQFGGPLGKKMKMNRFTNIILSLKDYDAEQRYNMLDKAFNDWKGHHKQIDDVLVMGIKI